MNANLLPIDALLSEEEVKKLHESYLNPGLAKLLGLLNFDKVYPEAHGCVLKDSQGKEILDFLGGYGSLNFGHNPPEIMAAIESVSASPNILQAGLGRYPAILAHNLAQITPGELQHTFFSNSGAEAVEGALKFARSATGKTRLISIEGSFHGKTMGALSLTGKEKYQKPYKPMVPDCETIPFGDTYALERALKDHEVAAIMIEPILGEGGVLIHPNGYLQYAQDLCRHYGKLFIVDEVQTGMGRTGRNFACEHYGLEPDILCLAKSLGGGCMPIGATITTEKVWQDALGGIFKCLNHTSTFGANARACAAGIAAIEILIRDCLAARAAEKGERLMAGLLRIKENFGFIKDVRGLGLLIGVEFDSGGLFGKAAYDFIGSMIAGVLLNEYGILTAYTLNNPTVVRIEPPLIITDEQIDYFLDSFSRLLNQNSSARKLSMHSGRTMLKSVIG